MIRRSIPEQFRGLFGTQHARVDERVKPSDSKFVLWVNVRKLPLNSRPCACKEMDGVCYAVQRTEDSDEWVMECKLCGVRQAYAKDESGGLYPKVANNIDGSESHQDQVEDDVQDEDDVKDEDEEEDKHSDREQDYQNQNQDENEDENEDENDDDDDDEDSQKAAHASVNTKKRVRAKVTKRQKNRKQKDEVQKKKKHRTWTVLNLHCDMEKLNHIGRLKNVDAEEQTAVKILRSRYDNARRCFSVEFYEPNAGQRLHSTHGMMRLPGAAQRYLCHDQYWDFDGTATDLHLLYSILKTTCKWSEYRLELLKQVIKKRKSMVNHVIQECERVTSHRTICEKVVKRFATMCITGRNGVVYGTLINELKVTQTQAREILEADSLQILQDWQKACVEQIQPAIVRCFAELDERARQQKKGEYHAGVTVAHVLQMHERKCVDALITFCERNSVEVGDINGDGIFVRKQAPIATRDAAEAFLQKANQFVRDDTGINLPFALKSLDWHNPHDEQFINGPLRITGIEDAYAFIIKQDLVTKYLKCVSRNSVFVFDQRQNCWTQEDVEQAIKTHIDAIRGVLSADGFDVTEGVIKDLVAKIKRNLPIDQEWLERSYHRCIGKQNFRNGYFDMREWKFVPGENVDMGFTFVIPRNFTCTVNADLSWQDDDALEALFGTILTNPFGPSLDSYILEALGRSIAGDQTLRNWFMLIGQTNSGKGVLISVMKAAFGSMNVGQILSETLTHSASQDAERMLGMLSAVSSVAASSFRPKL